MDTSLLNILTNIGLTEKESRVYLACLEKNNSPVSVIAKNAKINRVTTYDILEKLKEKGMVSFYTKQKIKYFNAINPELLLERFEKRTNDLRRSLPDFKRISGETSHPRIRYFEGIEGIKEIYTDTLTAKTEILNYSNSKEIRKNWPTYDKDYVSKRASKKIHLRGICLKDEEGEKVKTEDEKYYREMHLLPEELFHFTNEINVYDDKVAIISFADELIGMIIESTEIANSQRAIFNMCWQYAETVENVKTKLLKPITKDEIIKSAKAENSDTGKKPKNTKDNLSLF